MAFNKNNINLGNQFSHAAEVAKGEARENDNRSRPYYKLPQGIEYHKWTENKERFNILLAKNNAADDDVTGYKFYRAVQVHELPNMADPKHPHRYPCLRMVGKPCPCCDRKDQLDDGSKGGENWERIKPYLPKERVLYYFNPEGTDKILVHECAAKQKGEAAFPQRLMAQATAMSEGSTPIPFASPTSDGRIVQVNTAKDNFNGNEYYNASAVNFFPRRELPDDSLYDRCLPWNDLLNFGTYDEMERVMNGGEPDPYTNGKQSSQAQKQHTENQKQAEFERACEQQRNKDNAQPQNFQPAQNFQPSQQPPQGFMTSPANAPADNLDFDRDPYSAPQRTFPTERTQAAQGGCPNGLRFGKDFSASRKCCNCAQYAQCEMASRNG